MVTLDQDGKLFLTMGTDKREPIDEETLVNKVSAFVRENPQLPVLVAADERLDYGKVMQTLVFLQSAGVPKVRFDEQARAVGRGALAGWIGRTRLKALATRRVHSDLRSACICWSSPPC